LGNLCHNGGMSGPKAPIQIDAELLRRAEARASERGRAAGDLVEEAVQRYLELDEVMERVWGSSPDDLSEDESLDFANRELHAMRAERTAQQP
jgi:hypothetical protein